MAKVRITTPQQQDWQLSGERARDPAASRLMADGGPASAYKIREPGSESAPQLVELRYHAYEVIELHCHDQDEILYILEGAMQVGGRTLGPGATLSIAGGVFYTFEAGPEGLHLLNFRPRIDTSFHLPDAATRGDAAVTA
jgi:mannose-6-phosphate isomerase-like protein (cupin superfamily)